MNREIAWRVFAGEYNDANKDVSGGGERSPSYVVTPLGAKINRLFVVGVLTDVENVATDEAEGGKEPAAKPADAKQEALEQAVLGIIGELDSDGKGASWDGILARATKAGVDKDGLEEVINSLLDKGLVYEPILGRMKRI